MIGGSRDFAPCSGRWTLCAWITFEALQAIGKFQRAAPQPRPGAGFQALARIFFLAVKDALDDTSTGLGASLPIIAEDLGEITPDVIELRDQFRFARHEDFAVRFFRAGQCLFCLIIISPIV